MILDWLRRSRVLRWILHTLWLLSRHAVAITVAVLLPVVIWTVLYAASVILAVISDAEIISPIVFIISLMVVAFLATSITLLMYTPSVIIAEWIGRVSRWPILIQIPICMVVYGIVSLAVLSVAAALSPPIDVERVLWSWIVLGLFNAIPLGLYWWIVQSGPLAIALVRLIYEEVRTWRGRHTEPTPIRA